MRALPKAAVLNSRNVVLVASDDDDDDDDNDDDDDDDDDEDQPNPFFVRWVLGGRGGDGCQVGPRDSIFHSMYRGLVTNKSLVFSSKKVEFPASLVKR